MLVRFNSSTSGEMVMLARHARILFDVMDKATTARGVFTTEQLPHAIAALQQAIEEDKRIERECVESSSPSDEPVHDERSPLALPAEEEENESDAPRSGDAPVLLRQRAVPLIHLMEWTLKEAGYIVWEAEKDF